MDSNLFFKGSLSVLLYLSPVLGLRSSSVTSGSSRRFQELPGAKRGATTIARLPAQGPDGDPGLTIFLSASTLEESWSVGGLQSHVTTGC